MSDDQTTSGTSGTFAFNPPDVVSYKIAFLGRLQFIKEGKTPPIEFQCPGIVLHFFVDRSDIGEIARLSKSMADGAIDHEGDMMIFQRLLQLSFLLKDQSNIAQCAGFILFIPKLLKQF